MTDLNNMFSTSGLNEDSSVNFYSRQTPVTSTTNKDKELMYLPPIRCFTCGAIMKHSLFKKMLEKHKEPLLAWKEMEKKRYNKINDCCKSIYLSDPTLEYKQFSTSIMSEKNKTENERIFRF